MIAAVVLAAGLSTRMGRPKQTLELDGETILERVLDVLREAGVERVVVVLGAGAAEVRKRVKLGRVSVVLNRAYREGMSSSIKAGIGEVENDADAAMVVLGDQPFVSPLTIRRLARAYSRSRALIVVPVYRGARGNPVILDRRLFAEIKEIRGDVGAKSVVRRHGADVLEVAVDDPGVLADIDTELDYDSAVQRTRPRRSPGAG